MVLPQPAQIPGLVRYQSGVCTALHTGADSWELDALSPQQRARFRKIQRPPMRAASSTGCLSPERRPSAARWHRIIPASRSAANGLWTYRRTSGSLPRAALRQIGQLRLCASTTGTSNFTFIMWLRAASDVTDIEADFLAAVPGARIVESSLTVKFVKRVGWMLNTDTTATGEVVVPRPPTG